MNAPRTTSGLAKIIAAYAAVRRRTSTEQNEHVTVIRPVKHAPADSADDGATGHLHPAYCFIHFQAPMAYVNQPKGLVSSEGYHVVIPTTLILNGMEGIML